MATEINIGDRVRVRQLTNYDFIQLFTSNYIFSRKKKVTGTVLQVFSLMPACAIVKHDPVIAQLSAKQQREISQKAVYLVDELELIDKQGNPRKENIVIKWLRNAK